MLRVLCATSSDGDLVQGKLADEFALRAAVAIAEGMNGGGLFSSFVRCRVAISISNLDRRWRSRISRRCLRTFVPGQTYGSVFPVSEFVNSRSHLFECQFASDVMLENSLGAL
jgi:hypothetical protein